MADTGTVAGDPEPSFSDLLHNPNNDPEYWINTWNWLSCFDQVAPFSTSDPLASLPVPTIEVDPASHAPLQHEPWSDAATTTNASCSYATTVGLTSCSTSIYDGEADTTGAVKRKCSSELEPLAKKERKPRKTFEPEEKQRTAMTRELGACLECQVNKRRCDDGVICEKCRNRMSRPGQSICVRAKLQDVEVVRPGPTLSHAWTLRWLDKKRSTMEKTVWKPVDDMRSRRSCASAPHITVVHVSQGYTGNNMKLRVQEYVPTLGDKTDHPWHDGTEDRSYTCPPFAIAEVEQAYDSIQQFSITELAGYIGYLVPETEDVAGKISRTVFQMAVNVAEVSTLVKKALQFWVAGRFIEKPWNIVGDEKLGMSPDDDVRSPYHGLVPVTPIMDFMIDNITINKLLKEVFNFIRTTIKKKTLPRKKEDWFEIYLTIFILLNHVDLTMAHDIDFARRHNFPPEQKWSNEPLIEMVTHGANILLTIFQYEKGYYPLSASPAELARSYGLTDPQKEHLASVQALFGQSHATSSEPGDALYWTSKMRQSDGNPVAVKVA